MSRAAINQVMKRGPSRFNMVGQLLPHHLHDTEEKISSGLADRLLRYAAKVLADAGFEISGWQSRVYTMDGDLPPPERYYCVDFSNEKGGSLGIQGIMTSRGYPCLDHGMTVDFTPPSSKDTTHDQ